MLMSEAAPLIEVNHLVKHFRTRSGAMVRAVDDVSFFIRAGETVGLVGESGCGKSTLGRLVMGLLRPTSGDVRLDGDVISNLSARAMRPHRRRMQIVFQDPYSALNPRKTIGRIIEEPLLVHGLGSARERRQKVLDLMARVSLPAEAADLYPHEFSGGQRQRVGIARALAVNPALIVADEPVSALDVSVQAQVINLLLQLQKEFGLSYLFISHDLAVVQYVADRILVMYLGKIVEMSDERRIWRMPLHPYTAGLLAAHPVPQVMRVSTRRATIAGDVPSPVAPPSGCRFHPRCAFAVERCAHEKPALRAFADGRSVACHLVEEGADGSVTTPAQAL